MKNDYEIRGETTAIFIKYKGEIFEALIDTDCLEIAANYTRTWYLRVHGAGDHKYVQGVFNTKNKQSGRVFILHRMITECPKGMYVDHINHDTLDNRKSNLRVVTHQQNQQNRDGAQKNNLSSGIRGISWIKKRGKWGARIKVRGKQISLGYHSDIEEAKRVVEKARSIVMPFSKDAELNYEYIYEEFLKLRSRPQSNGTSGVRNVSFDKRSQRYLVIFEVDRKYKCFGRFETLEEAKPLADELRSKLDRHQVVESHLSKHQAI